LRKQQAGCSNSSVKSIHGPWRQFGRHGFFKIILMLLVEGTLLKDYGTDGGLAKADELIEKFKLKSYFTGKQSFEVTLGKALRIVSPAHDNLEMVGSHTEATAFSAVYEGHQFTIRYYETVSGIPRKGNIEKRYKPMRIGLSASTFFNKETEKEKALFLLLHPNCEQSPFRKKGGKTMWSVVDRQAESKKGLEIEILHNQVTALVFGADNDTLRRKAHGIKILDKLSENKGTYLQVRDATNADNDSIRLDLVRIAKKYPQEFLEQWNDAGNDVFGILQGAVSNGIIEGKATSLGNYTWKWRAGVNDGIEITTVPKVVDPMTGLVSYCIENDFPEIAKVISRASGTGISEERLDGIMAATFGKKPIDMNIEELVAYGKSRQGQGNAIYFDAVGKKVILVDGGYEPIGEPLLTVKDKALWSNELTVALEDKILAKRLRKHLE
jgi:hypothetical protein